MSLAEFCSGALFSGALLGAGVYSPDIIKAQFTFSSNTMITVMMGASATSAIVLDVEDRLKIMPKKHRSPKNLGLFDYDGNVLGGALIGIGMASTGACPGTTLVQAGMGMPNGILVGLGGLAGAMIFVKLQSALERRQATEQADESAEKCTEPPSNHTLKPLDIATALGITPLTLLLIWVPMCLAVMGIVFKNDESVRQTPHSGLVPPAYGGLLVGFAQLATTLFTRHSLGASAAYEDVARWIYTRYLPHSSEARPGQALITPSVIFSGGVVCAAAAISHFLRKSGSFGIADPINLAMATKALIGGMGMIIGARLAGGCTSGHGISGLARFSLASLVTTAAMFSGGIATAALFRF